MTSKKVNVIDVRSPLEFASGCVEGSINIPMEEIPLKIEEIRNMPKPIIFCCASGARSGNVCSFLTQHGITDIQNGGAWQNVAMLVG